MNINVSCAYCGGPLVLKRVQDEKWIKNGRVPREGRGVLICEKCGQRAKRRGLTPGRALASAEHIPVEENC